MKQGSKFASFFVFPISVLLAHLIASKVLNLYIIFPNMDIPFQLLNTNIQISLANTMQDQFMGILGGVTWMFIYTKKFEKITENRIPS